MERKKEAQGARIDVLHFLVSSWAMTAMAADYFVAIKSRDGNVGSASSP